MMTLQAEVVSKSLYGSHPICGSSEMAVDLALHSQHQHHGTQAPTHLGSPQTSPSALTMSQRESLCLSASSLHALQNLQPWGGEMRMSNNPNTPISLHGSNIDPPFPITTSALCWFGWGPSGTRRQQQQKKGKTKTFDLWIDTRLHHHHHWKRK